MIPRFSLAESTAPWRYISNLSGCCISTTFYWKRVDFSCASRRTNERY